MISHLGIGFLQRSRFFPADPLLSQVRKPEAKRFSSCLESHGGWRQMAGVSPRRGKCKGGWASSSQGDDLSHRMCNWPPPPTIWPDCSSEPNVVPLTLASRSALNGMRETSRGHGCIQDPESEPGQSIDALGFPLLRGFGAAAGVHSGLQSLTDWSKPGPLGRDPFIHPLV